MLSGSVAGFSRSFQLLFQIGDSRGSGFDVFGRLFFALLELVDSAFASSARFLADSILW